MRHSTIPARPELMTTPRRILLLGIVLAVVSILPLSAGTVIDPQHLKGKHRDEIIKVWGPPTKIKRHDTGKEVLVYIFPFHTDRLVEAGEYGFDVPSGDDQAGPSAICVSQEWGSVRGRVRFKLYLGQDGYVVKVKQRTRNVDLTPPDSAPGSLHGAELDAAVEHARENAAAQKAE